MSVDGSFQKRVKTRSRIVPAQLFCAGFLCIIVWTDSGRRLLLVIAVVKHESLSLQPHTASVSAAVMTLLRAGTGHPGLGTKHCLELFAQGLVPLRWGCAREPKRTCQGPKTHPHVSALQQSSGEAQSGRRFLGTKGGTLWLWSFLPKTGALGP